MASLIRHRKECDCGVAALAMYAGVAYEDAYLAFSKVDPAFRERMATYGLLNRDVVAAAKFLNLTLAPTRKFDLDIDEGVLTVIWLTTTKTHKAGDGHFVCVVSSVIICSTLGTVTYWKDYLEQHHGKAATLLKG